MTPLKSVSPGKCSELSDDSLTVKIQVQLVSGG